MESTKYWTDGKSFFDSSLPATNPPLEINPLLESNFSLTDDTLDSNLLHEEHLEDLSFPLENSEDVEEEIMDSNDLILFGESLLDDTESLPPEPLPPESLPPESSTLLSETKCEQLTKE